MDEIGWSIWKSGVIKEYKQRMANMASFGGQSMKLNGLSAISILTGCPDLPADNFFSEMIKISENEGKSPSGKSQNGGISMLGHQFGMYGLIESTDNIHKYFDEAYRSLQSSALIILTFIILKDPDSAQNKTDSGNNAMSFQSGNLFGPYFGFFYIDENFLENQVKKTNWNFKLITKDKDGSYCVLLT